MNHECGPLSLLALDPNGPLVGLNDGLDDEKPQAGTFNPFRTLKPPELGEQKRKLRLGNTNPRVFDRHTNASIVQL